MYIPRSTVPRSVPRSIRRPFPPVPVEGRSVTHNNLACIRARVVVVILKSLGDDLRSFIGTEQCDWSPMGQVPPVHPPIRHLSVVSPRMSLQVHLRTLDHLPPRIFPLLLPFLPQEKPLIPRYP